MSNLPSATEILRWAHCYDRYSEIPIDADVKTLAMLRGDHVDKALEYMALGAKLENAHAAAHIREYGTRRGVPDTPATIKARAEAQDVAFCRFSAGWTRKEHEAWLEVHQDCRCMGFLRAGAKFLAEHPLTLVEAQFTVVNRKLGYVGHPDWLVHIGDGSYELLSIKTGDLPSFAGIQEALYLLADPDKFTWLALVKSRYHIGRAVVQLREDGGYTYKPLTDYRDFAVAERWAAGFHDARRINGDG